MGLLHSPKKGNRQMLKKNNFFSVEIMSYDASYLESLALCSIFEAKIR